ncbi:hypothetical protein EMIHUDRAFT_465077 [Emiliania huxleyi CCMP1516]|uniref:Uncharacterized protein n=2 Tax=Emiliania huxleyi TaxID=2903 RepID=A0A0D3IJE3_EMIH1|nr:hypothetical protein EMIHUDRAFT_465077 [Emiliania huxleyi CCMP1516]EOD11378.1 hypothetical protein EMIHUDRAFT_465077 [Emiliania huxleyi CCMP1516]|eukprot:XP_005763807.1 hypothetical protein EMIHUDRAFT_465077 [Emiliania huxleyi CCMP1516]
MTAALRVNVLWKYIFSEPARWLTGKAGELGWGLDDSSELLDAIYDIMQAVAADGRRLLDPAYDPFASFAAKYPEFAAWRAAHAKEELKAADGTSYPIHAMVLAEAREPTRAGNIQCEARVITLAEEMAEAALFAMRDPRRSISSMLVSQGGKFAVGADPGRNAATAGAHATNDRVESNFGCLDILMRMPKPEAQQLEYLRYQIEMRVLGLGWSEYATRWSSAADSRIGTVAHLTKLLEELIKGETARKRFPADSVSGLPTEAAPPQLAAGGSTQLGTLDADAVEVRSTTRFNSDELKRKAEAEVERRIAAGISDDTEWRQPEKAPAFDSALVGKRLEVLWKYADKDTNQPHMIWSTGRVEVEVLPAGAVLWAWDADPEFDEAAGEQWLFLLPKKWNPKTHKQVYSWRYDPRELGAVEAPTADPRRRQCRRDTEQ